MSADNGIVICKFPNGEFRVAHVFLSTWDELMTPYYSPIMAKKSVERTFEISPVFYSYEAAKDYAVYLESRYGWTEYGIFFQDIDFDFGELGPEREWEHIPDWACPKCSTPRQMYGHNESLCDSESGDNFWTWFDEYKKSHEYLTGELEDD